MKMSPAVGGDSGGTWRTRSLVLWWLVSGVLVDAVASRDSTFGLLLVEWW